MADPRGLRDCKPGTRLVLTQEARSRFPVLGTRASTLVNVEHWLVVRFDGDDMHVRLPPEDFERI